MTSRNTRIPVLLATLLVAASASAQVLSVEYAAGNDPTTEGWGTQCPGNGVGRGFVDDGGTPAWYVDDNTSSDCWWYIKGVPAGDVTAGDTTGFVLLGRVRAVDVPDHPHGSPYFKYSNGVRTWEVRFGNQADGDLLLNLRTILASDDGIYVPVEGSGPGYHDIEVVYDAADALADVYVDGALVYADYAGATFTQGQIVGWGAGRSPDQGQGNFNLIQLWVGLSDPVADEGASWGRIKTLYGTR